MSSELRSIQIEDDEMEMSDDDRDYQTMSYSKRKRYDSDNLKDENDSLRHQLDAMRHEMSLERTDLKYNSDFREKQMKVLQETIRNMQTQLLQTKMREQKDSKTIEQLERRLKEAGVKQLLLKTKIRETNEKLREREACGSVFSESSEVQDVEEEAVPQTSSNKLDKSHIIDIDVDKSDDEVKIIESQQELKEIRVKCKDKEKPEELKLPEAEDKILFSSTKTADDKIPNEKPMKNSVEPLTLDEAKIIALGSAYLLVQPAGSSTPAICAYIKSIIKDEQVQESYINKVLQKYANIFQMEVPVDECRDDAKVHENVVWKFCAFNMQTN